MNNFIRKNKPYIAAFAVVITLVILIIFRFAGAVNNAVLIITSILAVPLFFVFYKLDLLDSGLVLTKKNLFYIFLTLFMILLLTIFLMKLEDYRELSIFDASKDLFKNYFYIILFFGTTGLLFIALPIYLLKLKERMEKKFSGVSPAIYDPYQAASFIYQRINDDLAGRVSMADIVQLLDEIFELSKSIKDKAERDKKALENNQKFTAVDLEEISQLEENYLKEMGIK